jgi:hypothetical protein
MFERWLTIRTNGRRECGKCSVLECDPLYNPVYFLRSDFVTLSSVDLSRREVPDLPRREVSVDLPRKEVSLDLPRKKFTVDLPRKEVPVS